MEANKINPKFEDLQNPETLLSHVEELTTDLAIKRNHFPVEVFPNAIQEIIATTNESLNFPTDFIGASILYAVSVSIGNTHRVEIKKGWQESAVLYLSIVGRPGTNYEKLLPISLNQKVNKAPGAKSRNDNILTRINSTNMVNKEQSLLTKSKKEVH